MYLSLGKFSQLIKAPRESQGLNPIDSSQAAIIRTGGGRNFCSLTETSLSVRQKKALTRLLPVDNQWIVPGDPAVTHDGEDGPT